MLDKKITYTISTLGNYAANKGKTMILKVFSVRDSKGNVFNTPFCKHNERDAIYDFKRLVNDKQTLPGQYPKDFDLYVLGTYDDQTGKFACLDQAQHLEEGIRLLDVTQESNVTQITQ